MKVKKNTKLTYPLSVTTTSSYGLIPIALTGWHSGKLFAITGRMDDENDEDEGGDDVRRIIWLQHLKPQFSYWLLETNDAGMGWR